LVPDSASSAGIILIHQLTKGQTQMPFKKNKGLVQKVLFHPSKPIFIIATQRYVKIYDLQKQVMTKRLMAGVKWISSMDVHPKNSENIIIGSYDQRLCWFDSDLSLKPYKTLRYHRAAIRQVCFHKKYPLFASCSDDKSIQIFYGMVYQDLEQNPAIYPVKLLKQTHERKDHYGAMFCIFHPTQPWLFSSGGDGLIKLWS
jgi:ribosome biogenesis protein ERB1